MVLISRDVLDAFKKELILAVRRFPIPMICAAVFCAITLSELPDPQKLTYLEIAFYGCFFFIALKLIAESRHWGELRFYIIGIPIFAALALYVHTSSEAVLIFFFLGPALFLAMFIAPFINKHSEMQEIWVFNYRLWSHIFITTLAAIFLYLGLSAIVASLDFLFSVKFYHDIYEDIWFVVATLFSPIVAMAGIPRQFDEQATSFPKFLRIILCYIVIPLLLVYAVILYGYTAKIIITWELPKGGVAYLVSGFGCLGVIIYLASYPLHQTSRIIALYKQHFFKLLLIPLLLLAAGIYTRIHDYGITEERYVIVLCLLWLFVVSGVAFAQKAKLVPKVIFTSLIVFLIAASFGPWGAIYLSAKSQIARLESVLKRNGALANGVLVKAPQEISWEDRVTISSIAEYLVESGKIDRVRSWFAGDKSITDITPEMLLEHAEIKYIESYDRPFKERENVDRIDFYGSWPLEKAVVAIKDYDYMIRMDNNLDKVSDNPQVFSQEFSLDSSGSQKRLRISVDVSKNLYTVAVIGDEKSAVVFPLIDIMMDARKKPDNKAVVIADKFNDKIKAKLIITYIYAEMLKGKPAKISGLATTLFVQMQ